MRTTPMLTMPLLVSLLAAPAAAASGDGGDGGDDGDGGGEKVVVVAVAGEDALRDRTRARASAAIADLGHRPKSPEEAGLSEEALLACARSGAGCKEAFAPSSAARVLVLRPEGEASELAVTGWLFHGATGEELAADRRFCRPCGASGELERAVGELVEALARTDSALRRAETRLVIHTAPPGGLVEVNGRTVGPSGRAYAIAPGVARVVVTMSGYLPIDRQVRVAEGATETLHLELTPTAESEGPGLFRRIAPWAALGAGAGAAAFGLRWIAIDGDRVGGGKRRATLIPGIVATGAGAALLATSAVLFWQARGDSRSGIALMPREGGAELAIGGVF